MVDSESESKLDFGKVPTFDGDEDKYPIWWSRFQAVAKLKGFNKALVDGGDPDLPDWEDQVIDTTTPEGKRMQAAVKRNDVAISCFTMAFTTESLIGLIYKAQDDIWPNGLAYRVVDELKAMYRPKDRISRVELRARLNKVKMNQTENPKVLFEQVAAIQNMFKSSELTIDDEEMIAVVLGQAPKCYTTVLATEQQIRGDTLMLKHLEKAMNTHWRINGADVENGENEESELGLTSFEGVCYKCKKTGHKAYQCKAAGGSNSATTGRGTGQRNKRFTGNCNNCGKRGHKKAQCWDLEENKHKRPGAAREGAEHGSAAVEFLLLGEDQKRFPDSPTFLKNPCVWIADSGATTHSTPYSTSITNRKGGSGAKITMGNGIGEEVMEIGDISGTICDEAGNKIQRTTLTDVCVCPKAAYNLFSWTKMTAQGWTMRGDKESITLQKGNSKVKFDIKISTPKGALFCMYMEPESEVAGAAIQKVKSGISINMAHDILGHADERRTRATAQHLGWKLSDEDMKTCGGCTAAKAKQKNVPKESTHIPASQNGERVFLDLSSVKVPVGAKGNVKTQHWRMLVVNARN